MTKPTELKLVVNEPFKKVMNTSCTINMDNEVIKTDDFVAVAYNSNTGETTMHSNTDALTLGQAHILIQQEFLSAMALLTEAQRQEVLGELG